MQKWDVQKELQTLLWKNLEIFHGHYNFLECYNF